MQSKVQANRNVSIDSRERTLSVQFALTGYRLVLLHTNKSALALQDDNDSETSDIAVDSCKKTIPNDK